MTARSQELPRLQGGTAEGCMRGLWTCTQRQRLDRSCFLGQPLQLHSSAKAWTCKHLTRVRSLHTSSPRMSNSRTSCAEVDSSGMQQLLTHQVLQPLTMRRSSGDAPSSLCRCCPFQILCSRASLIVPESSQARRIRSSLCTRQGALSLTS